MEDRDSTTLLSLAHPNYYEDSGTPLASDDYGYDPRTRPFYTRAVAAGQPIWTPPYVFFGQEIPGITYAAPRWDPKKRRIGVFAGALGSRNSGRVRCHCRLIRRSTVRGQAGRHECTSIVGP